MATTRRSPARTGQTSNRPKNLSAVPRIKTAEGGDAQKLHSTRNFVQEQTADPGPWFPVTSTRMRQARYDYGIRAVYVEFTSGIYWIYESVPLAVFWQFIRAKSKGKFINRVLNNFPYREADPDEAARPTTHVNPRG
jgi:hypothetical protein